MSIIGLDIGTTGCKCIIAGYEGDVKSFSYKEYYTKNPGPGLFELDPIEVWDAVRFVISDAVKQYAGDRIKAICISSFGESAVPVSRNGEVLYNSFLYIDTRGKEQADYLISRLGLEKIMNTTGLHAHPMYTICKMMWMRDNLPEVFKNTWKFMLYGDYILYKLGKVTAIDYSLASRTMAFNVTGKIWERSILDAAGIEETMFSKAVPAGTVVGNIDREVASEFGLPDDVLLVAGGHDQVCAAIGAGVIREGSAIDGIGSVECITPTFNKPLLNKQMLDNNYPCVPHARDGMYATYAFNFTGGSLLKWYRDNFAAEEKLEAARRGISVYSLLDMQADKRPSDILVLPHFAGSGSPHFDSSSKGAIVGLSFDTTRGQLYRAVLEGVTYEMYYNIECLENAGVKIDQLRAVGGGAKSDIWLQIKSDIMNIPIITLNIDEAGTLGTVMLAGIATGVYSSLADAAGKLVKLKKEFLPNKETHEIYLEKYNRYQKMYRLVKEVVC
jgi:xylulokinase